MTNRMAGLTIALTVQVVLAGCSQPRTPHARPLEPTILVRPAASVDAANANRLFGVDVTLPGRRLHVVARPTQPACLSLRQFIKDPDLSGPVQLASPDRKRTAGDEGGTDIALVISGPADAPTISAVLFSSDSTHPWRLTGPVALGRAMKMGPAATQPAETEWRRLVQEASRRRNPPVSQPSAG